MPLNKHGRKYHMIFSMLENVWILLFSSSNALLGHLRCCASSPDLFANNNMHHDQGVSFEMCNSVIVGQSDILKAAATSN